MLGGSTCPSGSGQASTIIDFVCDTAVFGAGQPRLVAQLPMGEESCSFFVEWRTHVACPTGARSGPWGFFVTLIVLGFILLMLYLTLGTVYNRFVLNLRGFDQIPSFSLEGFRYHASEALDWFRDTMSGLYEGGQGGRYELPRTNPVSHQTGVDGGETGGFVRLGRNRPDAQPSTNPVSHQSQVNASQPRPPSTPPPPSPTTTIRPAPPSDKEEERPFMVGDDDDDDGEVSPVSLPHPVHPQKPVLLKMG
ncbi:hypothetical protein CPB85DRAFT_1294455 [Mucidula mucida]|nr:hypothetical protein CPB85DRAFT_1294455 [Mucidula mucida]